MLKSLELFGFKSFADRTKFDFAPGVTCVVGPNGSGKSNVVDAIKWIFGDQSAKSLRGKEMTDVIFNGAANRKPTGFAEATLTFDNSKRLLALDMDEVHIGRRIYRSGEAEYLINRATARLKDVRDLFLGTGAGTAAYSIIEQGRVDQLLQASPANRRIVFEEAAGVSRFRAKKVDAERKLERVAQNLLRLQDIVTEVETRLLQMRAQATKAAKFRELSHELQSLRIGLAADDYREVHARLEAMQGDRELTAAKVDALSREAQDFEALQRDAEKKLNEVEDQLRVAERREAENRETMAGHEATLRHQQERRRELDADVQRLQKQQSELQARAAQVAGELSQTVDDLERFSGEFDRRRESLQGEEETIKQFSALIAAERDGLEKLRGQLLEAVRQASMFANRVTALESQIESLKTARDRDRQRYDRLDGEVAASTVELIKRQEAVNGETGRLEELREQLRTVQQNRQEILLQLGEAQQRLVECKERRSAMQARKHLLEDLERRQEGLGIGVKEILTRAKNGDGPPWDHVLGHVVDLLEVDLENAAPLEVALGARAQLIVLDDATPLVDYLHGGPRQITGRVGFLAVPDHRAEMDEPVDLSRQPGVVSRADGLVRASSIPGLPARLLSDTWIVHSLDVALRLSQRNPGCRFVTLQGELVEANGTLYVGQVRSESALISRKSELRGIKAELQKLDRQISAEEQAVQQAVNNLAKSEGSWQRIQTDLDYATQRFSELKSAASSQETDLERQKRDLDEVARDLHRTNQELERLAPELETARTARQRCETDLHGLQAAIDAAEREIVNQEQNHQTARAALATELMELAKQEERLENLKNARSRLDQERFQRDLHREEAERRVRLLDSKREQIEQEIHETERVLAELQGQRDGFAAETGVLAEARETARKSRGAVTERELQIRHQLRDLKEHLHSLSLTENEQRHQLTTLTERLREEYQLELSEVVKTGVSARQEYRAAQLAEGVAPEAEDEAAHAPAHAGGSDHEREVLEERLNRCRRKIKQLGQVSTESLQELDELETRFARLSGQLQDLVEAKSTLEEIIRRLNNESKRLFQVTFDAIRIQFQELFRKLFGGGEGDVILENPDDVLESGIDVVARPPGKELRSISLLSGGEKTMTAVALLLAMFKTKPSPFCILDEVDAALDEGNVERYLGVIREFQQWTQFIVVTHHKRTMSGADVLYGVTMEEAGVSKRMSVRFDDITDDGHIRKPAHAA